jgi:hypothetical protein
VFPSKRGEAGGGGTVRERDREKIDLSLYLRYFKERRREAERVNRLIFCVF